jgi:chaperonin GroEL
MARKHLLFHSAAREKVLRGAAALAEAVRVTLGPRSKCVLIGKKWGRPVVCNDGAAIAKEIELKDPDENLGAQMIREAAEKTGEAVGDGTSTATVLAQAIFTEGARNVAAGASAIDLKRGLGRGLEAAVAAIKALSRPVESRKEKAQLATISAHNDPVLGELVAEAMGKVGGEGVVSVEEAKGIETTLEVVEGMQFDRGYLSPYFVTDPEKMQAVLDEPAILLYEKKVSILKDLIPLLEQLAQARKSLPGERGVGGEPPAPDRGDAHRGPRAQGRTRPGGRADRAVTARPRAREVATPAGGPEGRTVTVRRDEPGAGESLSRANVARRGLPGP